LLLAFLALLLLLATATSEAPYQTLRLVGYSSDGVLSSLDGLVGYLARGILCSSVLPLLVFLVLLLLLRLA
jgi:hypothetical protein